MLDVQIIKWFFFTLGFSLLPLFIDFYYIRMIGAHEVQNSSSTIKNAVKAAFLTKGQLSLISAGLSSASLSELIFLTNKNTSVEALLICFIFLATILSILLYVLMQYFQRNQTYSNDRIISELCNISLGVFISSIFFNIASFFISYKN